MDGFDERVSGIGPGLAGAGGATPPAPGQAGKTAAVPYAPENGGFGVGDLEFPAGWNADTPVVLNIHGGGWTHLDRASWAGVAAFFVRDLKMVSFNIEYRLASEASPWPACGDDCLRAAEFLLSPVFAEKFGPHPRKIWICGGSAGGHLALWAGLNLPADRVAGIISVSGIADPGPDIAAHPDRYRFMTGEKRQQMSPLRLIAPGGPRILQTHADQDTVVPAAAATAFADAYRAAGNPGEILVYPHDAEPCIAGHCIWRPESQPHRLLALIEKRIAGFVAAGGK